MTISIIVAFSKNFGIGIHNALPWNIPIDLKKFQQLTTNNVVVMGHKTWLSIPENKKPLKNRLNVVVTRSSLRSTNDVVYVLPDELDSFLQKYTNIFIIGGSFLYKKYIGIANCIYATVIDKEYQCDTFFPTDQFHKYYIKEYSASHFSEEEQCNYRNIYYELSNKQHGEFEYLNLMSNILNNGNDRTDRTNTGTKSLFGKQISFDITKSIPLITTKFVGFKSIVKELLFFLKGKTDSKILEKQGVSIWKENTSREFLNSRGLDNYREGDMGPMYGFNWLHWNCNYLGCDHDYSNKGFNQIDALIHSLVYDPFSRRHLLTTYNPSEVDKSVLAPCHGLTVQFYVEVINEQQYLSCHMYQRSVDNFLGEPYNITSYSVLTYIIAKICNMKPKELIISMGDSHIYNNHIEQVKLQLSRSPLPFPILEINDSVLSKSIYDIEIDDFNLIGYLYRPSIKAQMAV